jgi:tetratricopeptide (TPR) repeat protein
MRLNPFGLAFFLLWVGALPAFGQTETKPLRYGDPGYVGSKIQFECKLCTVPNILGGLASLGGVQTEFPGEGDWRSVTETIRVENRPWNEVFDQFLQKNQLQAEWTRKGKLLITSRAKAVLTPSRALADLLEQLPPLPENTLVLSSSGRAIQGDRLFKEGIGSFALANDNDDRVALIRFAWAVQLFENVEYRGRQAAALNFLGLCYLDLDQQKEATRAFRLASELGKTVGNQRAEMLANLCLARIAIQDGAAPENAEVLADDALKFIKDLNSRTNLVKPSLFDRSLEGIISTQAGRVLYLIGKNEKAAGCLFLGYVISGTLEDQERNQVESLVILERAASRDAQRAVAQRAIENLRGIEKRTGSPRLRVSLKAWAGSIYGQCGEPTRALDWLQEALAGLRGNSDTGLETAINREMGRMYVALKKYTEARRFYDAALKLAQQNQDELWKRLLQEEMKQLP